jgi:hypothetical protein
VSEPSLDQLVDEAANLSAPPTLQVLPYMDGKGTLAPLPAVRPAP